MAELLYSKESLSSLEMPRFGIDTRAQAKRARLLIDTLGTLGGYIALKEKQDYERGYYHEFILDEPVGLPHAYYQYDGKLYSYPLKHNLVKIDNGVSIDPRERNGRTLRGFQRFEQVIAKPENQVAVWYSPSGKAGDEGPFGEITFDSGRLYISLKQDTEESIHFDIKVQEELFPVKELLDFLAGRNGGQIDLFDYLDKPFGITNMNEFLFKLQTFPEYIEHFSSLPVYVSRRNDKDRQTHDWPDIVAQIYDRINNPHARSTPVFNPQRLTSLFEFEHLNRDRFINNLTIPVISEGLTELTDERVITAGYVSMMRQFMHDTGRNELHLYGCSATNTVNRNDLGVVDVISSIQGEQNFISTPSIYSTAHRTGNVAETTGTRILECECPNNKCGSRNEGNGKTKAVIENGTITCKVCGSSGPYEC